MAASKRRSKPRIKRPACPVEAYARDVVDGRIIAGRTVILACERHLRDLQTGASRGLYWDELASARAIRFFFFLVHTEGEWAGVAFTLEPWQQFIIGSLFGWKRADGTRRFRTAYIQISRKNGKSLLASGVGLYLFLADDEEGAQVYSAATHRKQAKIVWGQAALMVRKSQALRRHVRISGAGPTSVRCNLYAPESGSRFEPLGADLDGLDGLNIHGAIIDELHAHRNRIIVDVIETATGARRQPLIFEVTTAGTDQNGICYEHYAYSRQVLERTADGDSWFAYIAELDAGDQPLTDEACWIKANPNLGISVKMDDLRRKVQKARQMPSAQNSLLRLHFNRWTQEAEHWIDLDLWDEQAGVVAEEQLAGRTCYGGLDLAAVKDFVAWALWFPRADDPDAGDVLMRFFCPRARLTDPANQYADQYQAWARAGFLTTTPGDATDYDAVKARIVADAQKFRLVDLNVDRLFQAHQLSMQLMDELGQKPDRTERVVGMGQGHYGMAAPCAEFERRLLLGKIHHGGNPVLRFCAGNVATHEDASGNKKPDRKRSQGKIDGIVALIMALDRVMRHEPKQQSGAGISRL